MMTVLYVVTPTKERFRGLKQYGGSLKALDDADDLERWRWRIPRTQSLQLCANQFFFLQAKTAVDSESITDICKAHKFPTFCHENKLSKTPRRFSTLSRPTRWRIARHCRDLHDGYRLAQKLSKKTPCHSNSTYWIPCQYPR